jgi:hypothetical protein
MLVLSLLLNVVVLVPVCVGRAGDAGWARECYGGDAPARRILLAVYGAIGLVSVGLLFVRRPAAVGALLLVQIVYKVATPFTVGTLANPVVVSNLAIAAFHAATLAITWRGGGFDEAAG